MNFFNLKKTKANYEPYKEKSTNTIYNLLFCDSDELYKSNNESNDIYPWNIVLSENQPFDKYEKVINDTNLESRVKILAYRKMKATNNQIMNKELLAAIIEIGFDKGLDVLAAYKDGSARYINQSEKIIIWDTKIDESDMIINQLFTSAAQVVNQIGPWGKPRLPHPKKGNARLSFLVSDEIYFGEAPIDILFNDSMAGPVLNAGAHLIQFLVSKVNKQ